MADAPIPPPMRLLGGSCHCKTASTQTVPTADDDNEDEEADVDVETVDTDNVEEMEGAPANKPSTNPHCRSTQSSTGRVDSIFDGTIDLPGAAAQIVGIDQWSSSGTESTTGVILRSGVTTDWNQEDSKPEAPVPPQHSSNCPKRIDHIPQDKVV